MGAKHEFVRKIPFSASTCNSFSSSKLECQCNALNPPECSLAHPVSQLRSRATLVLSVLIPCPSLSALAPSDYPNFLPFVSLAFSLVLSAHIHISTLSSVVTFNPLSERKLKIPFQEDENNHFIQNSLPQKEKKGG